MLKEPNKDSTLLMVALRKGKEKVKISTGIKVKISTGIKVNPGSWNQARQSFASSERILNEILLQWKAAIVKEIQKAELEGLGVADVKKAVVERMGKVNARETKSESLFLPYFRHWAVSSFRISGTGRSPLPRRGRQQGRGFILTGCSRNSARFREATTSRSRKCQWASSKGS